MDTLKNKKGEINHKSYANYNNPSTYDAEFKFVIGGLSTMCLVIQAAFGFKILKINRKINNINICNKITQGLSFVQWFAFFIFPIFVVIADLFFCVTYMVRFNPWSSNIPLMTLIFISVCNYNIYYWFDKLYANRNKMDKLRHFEVC